MRRNEVSLLMTRLLEEHQGALGGAVATLLREVGDLGAWNHCERGDCLYAVRSDPIRRRIKRPSHTGARALVSRERLRRVKSVVQNREIQGFGHGALHAKGSKVLCFLGHHVEAGAGHGAV